MSARRSAGNLDVMLSHGCLRQHPAQVAHAATRPQLGGVGPDAEHLADLGEAEAPDVVQQQRFAPIRQHGVERAAKPVALSEAFDLGRHGQVRQLLIGLRPAAARRRSMSHTCLRDREDPGPHRQVRPVRATRSVNLQERLLQEVLRLTAGRG